jgi:hypothetical protein
MSDEVLQMSLPLMPATTEELYIDQAMVNGCGVFAAYTPWGIKEIDSMFCWRIQKLDRDQERVRRELRANRCQELLRWRKNCAGKPWLRRMSRPDTFNVNEKITHIGEGAKAIRKDILDNPHLHACIKQNLLENLDRVEHEITEERTAP